MLKTAHTAIPLTTGLSANYGLGWAVDTLNGKAVIQHGGSIGGYRAQGIRLPDDHIYMILLSNSGTTNSSLTLNKALSLLYNIAPVREQRQEIQSWKEMEGVYESLNSGSRPQKNMGDLPAFFTIRTDSLNRVTVQRSSSAALTLTPAGKDKLYDKSSPFTTWRFNRNAQGKVVSFTIEQLLPTMGPERTNLKIADIVPAIKQPVPADSAQLTVYTGLFRHELGSSARIVQVKNNLYMEDPEFKTKTQLHWLNGNLFWIKELDREVNFIRDKKGNVTSIQYNNGSQLITLHKSNELY